MNMNYSYPTTMYESNLAQVYVFLVLFTIFAFYHDPLAKIAKKYSSTTNMYISVKIPSYIVVRGLLFIFM